MSDSESGGQSSERYPPGSLHDRFSFSSESRPPTPVNINSPINPTFEERTRTKVDRRLIPALAVLYAITFIDTTNLPIARREGTDRDFGLLHRHRYYFVSFVFFLPSVFLQLPLILALRRVGTVLWLGTMVFLLGALQIASAFVDGWGQFLGLRALLGILEASVLPSCVYLISSWYKRSEMQSRMTVFYSASVFIGSFGNILGLGLSKIHTRGTDGWRWIFALEGLVTVLLSFYGYSIVLPFPDRKHTIHAPFLTREELQVMRQRIEIDRKDYIPDHLDKAKMLTYVFDANVWMYAILALCANTVVYSFPVLLQASLPSDRLNDAEIESLSIAIGVVATAMTLLIGFTSDRVGMLSPFLVSVFLLSTIGISMTSFSHRRAVRFAGCFLSYSGAQASIPIILSLQAMNVRQHSKRIFTISLVFSFAGIGALLSVLVFPVSAAPAYPAGLRTTLALQVTGVVAGVALMVRLRCKNRIHGATQPSDEGSSCPDGQATNTTNGDNAQAESETPGILQSLCVGHGPQDVEGMDGFKYMT